MRWNLSSRRRLLSGGDAVVLSIPKSGRTWLRVFLSAYFSAKISRVFSIDITDRRSPGAPRLIYSHDLFEQRTKGNISERLRGKYLVPRAQLTHAPIILLVRDPRDAFVSYYVQLTHRNHPAPESIKQLSVGILLRHPRFGIGNMVAVMNEWAREFRHHPDFTIVRYEDLRADPPAGFSKVLRALGQTDIDDAAFSQALQFSSFENMQRLEGTGAFADKILAPRDPTDPESFKVRRGEVGGFEQYLPAGDQEFAAGVCARLDPAFGYGRTVPAKNSAHA
jgi:Sulfotransferase domain